MRPLLAITVVALLAASTATWAWARTAHVVADTPAPAPLVAPAATPTVDPEHDVAWGFRTAAEIAADMTAAQAESSPGGAAAGGASATVVVTATVLPVVTIVRDEEGIAEIWINTDDRRADHVLFMVRDGSLEGPAGTLDDETWSAARAALLETTAGSGLVWSR